MAIVDDYAAISAEMRRIQAERSPREKPAGNIGGVLRSGRDPGGDCDRVLIASVRKTVFCTFQGRHAPKAGREGLSVRNVAMEFFDEYTLAVGRVVYTWNLLHERFALLLAVFTGMQRHIEFAILFLLCTFYGQC